MNIPVLFGSKSDNRVKQLIKKGFKVKKIKLASGDEVILKKETEAHEEYDKILKNIVYPLTGDKATYMRDLNGIGRNLMKVKFKGVYPSDRIPKLNELSPYCILNLDKSTESGSHWVALAKNGNNCILYDSFGRDNKRIIPALRYSGNGRIINDTNDREQKIEEEDCGARCLAWLIFLDIHGVKNAMLI